MKNKEYFKELGTTAACCLRGVKDTSDIPSVNGEEEEKPKRLYFGDSWFGSVKTSVAIGKAGHHAFMMVKTAHACSQKSCWRRR